MKLVAGTLFFIAVMFAVGHHHPHHQSFIATCENTLYDWTNPPRICRQGCAEGEVWSRQEKMCVMSCPRVGCT
jgi:hypothetical protein